MPNVENKIHIENIIKSIFNMLVAALVLFKNKDGFIFSTLANYAFCFVWKLVKDYFVLQDQIKFITLESNVI